jgi:hypothetical protein
MAEYTPLAVARRGLAILRLGTEWRVLQETRREGARFSLTFGHEVAHAGSRNSLVLLSVGKYTWDKGPDDDWFVDIDDVADEPPSLKIGIIRSVQAVSTLDSRVVFDLVQPIKPESLDALLSLVKRSALRSAASMLRRSEARYERVSEKLGHELIRLITEEPSNAAALGRIEATLRAPTSIRDARAMQQDAIRLALKAFGITHAVAASVELSGQDTALATVRLREDAVIEHDARSISGWELHHTYMTGRATFVQHGEQLEVFTANKQPLEELLGVDLIYLNHVRQALVMVQYKMLEPQSRRTRIVTRELLEYEERDEPEWIVPIDRQFKEELARMRRFDKDLAVKGPFRLHPGAFFFKLVKRYASVNTAGIILSLDHLEQLIIDGKASGPRGGLRISYNSLGGHYLRGEAFVELIRSGYIGTRGATTDHLRELIEAAVNGERAVVAAVQSEVRRVRGFSDFDPTSTEIEPNSGL